MCKIVKLIDIAINHICGMLLRNRDKEGLVRICFERKEAYCVCGKCGKCKISVRLINYSRTRWRGIFATSPQTCLSCDPYAKQIFLYLGKFIITTYISPPFVVGVCGLSGIIACLLSMMFIRLFSVYLFCLLFPSRAYVE